MKKLIEPNHKICLKNRSKNFAADFSLKVKWAKVRKFLKLVSKSWFSRLYLDFYE